MILQFLQIAFNEERSFLILNRYLKSYWLYDIYTFVSAYSTFFKLTFTIKCHCFYWKKQ
ncbi:MAG: hypothetical protein EXX96DRAFT_609453 [Benjaminiella poitrasii]|nr:MAG: hypothetical protein EXX96DRAFT_609453 [Benjaminiella poitrasii]